MSELVQLLPTEDLEAHYDDLLKSKYQGIDPTQCIMAHHHGEFNDMISESVVSPMMSPPKKSIVVSQRNMAKHEPVVTPTVSITQRTGPVVTSMVPSKNASRHATIQAEPVVTPTVSYMNAAWHALNYPEPVVT